ncbi:MAG: hypothetical protein M3Q07_11720 [Pseudobdellovibrionaceae bacterium]|nr:hypothetical protein [Pseudobdellovibrionaceae bacterium]
MTSNKSPSTASWQQHISDQRKSGKSRKSYCETHGLKLHQFNYYLRSIDANRKRTSAFSRVLVSEPPVHQPASTASAARLVLDKNMVLEFGDGADPEWIARVVAQLQMSS